MSDFHRSAARCTEKLRIAQPCTIDPDVLLGYVPGRGIPDETLTIGPGAVIRARSVIYAGSTIGRNFETGHNLIVREQTVIGDDTCIWSNCVIDYDCRLGSRVRINSMVHLGQGTVLEDDVFISSGSMLANDRFPWQPNTVFDPVTVRRGARIGINVSLCPGVVVGEEAFCGAGAVVTKDVPAGKLVVGNPARVVGDAPPPGGPR